MHIETTNYENLECYVTNRDKLTNSWNFLHRWQTFYAMFFG